MNQKRQFEIEEFKKNNPKTHVIGDMYDTGGGFMREIPTTLPPTSIEEAADAHLPPIGTPHRKWVKMGFIAGARHQEDLAIKFVNWIMSMKYEIESDGCSMWWSKDMKEYSTEDLFEIFKQEKT